MVYADDILLVMYGPKIESTIFKVNEYLGMLSEPQVDTEFERGYKWEYDIGMRTLLYRNARNNVSDLRIRGLSVKVSHTTKYLGVTFHSNYLILPPFWPDVRQGKLVFRIGGRSVKVSDTFKYLGVTFQSNFQFYRHIELTWCATLLWRTIDCYYASDL